MKPRFTPALCSYLEGMGFSLDSVEVIHDKKGKAKISIVFPSEGFPDTVSAIETRNEIIDNCKVECTNG